MFQSSDIPGLNGQVIIVTGSNAGLGLETVKQLSTHNPARIYVAARSQEKAEAAIKEIQHVVPSASPLEYLKLDLVSFHSIKAAAAEFSSRFGTSLMGTALFTQLLLPKLRDTTKVNPQTRVVILSSASHSMAPSDVYDFEELKTEMSDNHTTVRYTTSKLADIHYANALAEREQSVSIIPVHPGMVATNLHHASTGALLKPFLSVDVRLFATPVEKGALSQVWAAVSPDAQSGQYYSPVGKDENGSNLARDGTLQERLFQWVQKELEGHVETIL